MSFRNYRLRNTKLCKCLKTHVLLHPKTLISCNLRASSFISLADPSEKISIGKSLS